MIMNKAATLLRTAGLTRVPTRNKAYTGPLKVSMNDLPTPCGSWRTNYEALQRKYNAHLALGIAVFTTTIIFGKASGAFYMNLLPPAVPAEKNDYEYGDD